MLITLVVRAVQQVLVRRCDIFTWCNSWGLERCDPGRTESIFWSQHCHGNCKIAGGLNVLASEMAYKCACLWSSYAQDFALFACLMTLRLFLLDNQDMTSCANLNKVNWNCFFPNFERTYNIHRNISIDECIIPWRGRLSFRQFTASKPICFGTKSGLVDSDSKYIYRQQLYIGRNPGEKLATRAVTKLFTGLEGFGLHLYIDNFYTSVDLYQCLFHNKVYACGTIKGSRKNFAKEIK